MKIKSMKKTNGYQIFLVLILFSIYQFAISKICGFTLVPDEFGYWASAARNVGYDWSAVASLGSYYSFGYSLILSPILKLFSDGVQAYRAAVTVNMLLMCGGFLLLEELVRRIFPGTRKTKRILISGIAVCYPPWIFYMQMTMVESLLYFLFILIVFLAIHLMEKSSVLTAVLLALALAYIYCVHMRTIGVLLAGGIVLLLWMASESPKRSVVLSFWGVLLGMVVLAVFFKQNTIADVFAKAAPEMLEVNDYGRQWEKIRQILTIRGMQQFVMEVAAKIYYLGAASFGLFYWGMGWVIKKSYSLFKKLFKKNKGTAEEWIALFVGLSVTGEILVSSIYMYQVGLIDTLIYGRYDEFLMPVFLVAGMLAMSRSKWIFRGTALIGAGTGLLTALVLHNIKAGGLEGLRGYMVAGISYLLKEDGGNISAFFWENWGLLWGIMLFAAVCVWLSGRSRQSVWLTGVLMIEILAGLQISQKYVYRVNDSNFMDLPIAEEILEQSDAADRVLYLDEGAPQYVDFLQMQLGAKSIEVITEEQWKEMKAGEENLFLITWAETTHRKELETVFDQCLRANTFYLFYDKKEGV